MHPAAGSEEAYDLVGTPSTLVEREAVCVRRMELVDSAQIPLALPLDMDEGGCRDFV